jgi:hypothetical protein
MQRVVCSMCQRELRHTGNIANDIVSSGGAVVGGSLGGWNQWLGTVCRRCEIVFCENCRSTGPGACPICDADVKPAAAMFLAGLRPSRVLEVKVAPDRAEALARRLVPPEQILAVETVGYPCEARASQGIGSTPEEAIRDAEAGIPKDAASTGAKVVRQGETGTTEVPARSEEAALEGFLKSRYGPGNWYVGLGPNCGPRCGKTYLSEYRKVQTKGGDNWCTCVKLVCRVVPTRSLFGPKAGSTGVYDVDWFVQFEASARYEQPVTRVIVRLKD